MARAHYQNIHQGINRTSKAFSTPKNLHKASAWLTAVRKVIPQVPNPRTTDWVIGTFEPDVNYILIEMFNQAGQRCRIAIDRKAQAL